MPVTWYREGQRKIWPWLAIVAVLAAAVCQLRCQGRFWWCACGGLSPWVNDVRGPHNSQHFLDPYSLTHMLHGVVFCGLLFCIVPRLSTIWRLSLAVSMEALWEIVENSAFIIHRYRQTALAQGYEGDTILNSMGDVLLCSIGFTLASYLGFRRSILLFAATELILLVLIRDSLFLSIVTLIHPFDAISAWQTGR